MCFVFVLQTEAPLLIRPLLEDMTRSELHAVMTGGFATIAGTVLAAFISFGVSYTDTATSAAAATAAAATTTTTTTYYLLLITITTTAATATTTAATTTANGHHHCHYPSPTQLQRPPPSLLMPPQLQLMPLQPQHHCCCWHCHCHHFTTTAKLCQMLSWWTQNSLHSINFWDIVTKMVPLCSVYQAPSYESNFTLLAPFSRELAYFSLLFILGMVCTE